MKRETKKRIIWFAVFMFWIGMVSSILIYQNSNPSEIPAQNNSQPSTTPVIIEKADETGENNQDMIEIQFTGVKEKKQNQDFFVQYRLERDKARSEQINIYREMINNPNVDPSIKKNAQEALLRLTRHIEQEMEIESLIRARGFYDALAYMHENSIDLIIQTDGLTETDVTKIGDIVTKITDLRLEDITIIEKRITDID
ncbi:hypothetical protein BBF96_09185 [Anoxybacter fermentans]|uniref:SpoIIIAH-like family protein n=1 Tax=Anoxybacter fermentans TaxID=1323375 RepID=A0A3S9SZ31_9FIRM|nr:SpoIIIAH-like family protein [Anoxybacter fermentans]AZR73544.1 hypothetical protein BBF96_09185 [Anoxybacter fermentans]